MLAWWAHRYAAGILLLVIGPLLIGVSLSMAATGNLPGETVAQTRTLHETRTHTLERTVTVKVRGKVIRRYDHIIVVQVPRYIFVTRRTHQRIIVPPHVVRIRQAPASPIAAVLGVAPVPITITIPYPVPGPTTTIIVPTTITVPTTVTIPTTITVPIGGT